MIALDFAVMRPTGITFKVYGTLPTPREVMEMCLGDFRRMAVLDTASWELHVFHCRF